VVSGVAYGIQGSGPLVGGMSDPQHYYRVARAAEDAGFDSLWAGDHIAFHHPLLDVTVALTAFAAVTERISLGAGVVLLPLRAPALVAREFERYWLVGSPSRCVERIAQYVEAGARHIILHPAVEPAHLLDQIDLLAEVAHASPR
jgi:alkanesulfonate monooxygenase SsuD/methylene tetrahydromethanopterin reductase-like flavin-dependent oxidoreductase (luciferase family)